MPYTMRRGLMLLAALAAFAVIAGACGSGDSTGDDGHAVFTPVASSTLPVVISSDLGVGTNRFLLGLINQSDDSQVLGAKLHLRFFTVNGQQATLKFETDPAAIRLTKTYTHTHNDGKVETHQAGETGAYAAQVNFDSAGTWGVEVAGTVNGGPLEIVRPTFSVRQHSLSPAIGDTAPRSVQPLLSDVADIREIDTSEKPISEMHQKTIADAVASGKPTVIVFATPTFCVSQICGPAKQIVDELYDAHKVQANFVHVEPYFVDVAREGKGLCPLPFVNLDVATHPADPDCPALDPAKLPPPNQSWNLETEPWVFIVDRNGIIAGKFEGVVSREELEAALKQTLTAD